MSNPSAQAGKPAGDLMDDEDHEEARLVEQVRALLLFGVLCC